MSFMLYELMRGDTGGDSPGLSTLVAKAVANGWANKEQQLFATHAENFINPTLRKDSGAAVPISEYPKYFARFIPEWGNKPESVALKTKYRELYVSALEGQIANVAAAKGTDEYRAEIQAVFRATDSQFGLGD